MPRLSDDGTCYVHPIQNEFDWMVWESLLQQEGYELEINSMWNNPLWYCELNGPGWVSGERVANRFEQSHSDYAKNNWYVRAVLGVTTSYNEE